MTLDVWIGETVGRTRLRVRLVGAVVSGGRTVGGQIPAAYFDGGGFWRASEACSIRSDEHVRLWNGWSVKMQNGAIPVEVPVGERVRKPSGVTLAQVNTSAALRATTLLVTVSGGGDLAMGHRFTIDHTGWGARAYDILTAEEGSPGAWTLTFAPPLRESVSIATELDFDTPRVTARLTNADQFPIEEDGAVVNPEGVAEWEEWLDEVPDA